MEVTLAAFTRKGVGPNTALRGRLVDKDGQPVVGAKVEPEGVQRGSGTRWGGLDGIDPLAISDETGAFLITAKEPFDALTVAIEARGLAPLKKNSLAPDQEHVILLTEGASVSGRVLWEGKPLAGVAMGMAGANRMAGEFVGSFTMATGSDGRFLIPALPPETDYHLYGLMESLRQYGAIPARRVRTGADGTVADVGDVAVEPALRLAGQVRLSDGAAPPAQTRVTVGFDDAWDAQVAEVDSAGGFELLGLPCGPVVNVSTRVPGYRFSGRNASLDPWNPFHLVGRLDRNKTNLVVLLEPGERPPPSRGLSPEDHPRSQALRGAEPPQDPSEQQTVSGQVLDGVTREPIPRFQITPGRSPTALGRDADGASWETHRTESHTNGSYTITAVKSSRALVLLAEAEGYLPDASPALSADQTQYTFALKRGHGPTGTVLLPDGTPAVGIQVFFATGRDQLGLFPDGRMRAFGNREPEITTDAEGHFRFAPRLSTGQIYSAAPEGYVECGATQLAANSKITLQPWATIKGKLVQRGKPVPKEPLAITREAPARFDGPRLNLQHRVTTDAEGAFEFAHVPPGDIQIVTLVPLEQGGLSRGWIHQPQHKLSVSPGVTVIVEVEKSDAPPPGRPRPRITAQPPR